MRIRRGADSCNFRPKERLNKEKGPGPEYEAIGVEDACLSLVRAFRRVGTRPAPPRAGGLGGGVFLAATSSTGAKVALRAKRPE